MKTESYHPKMVSIPNCFKKNYFYYFPFCKKLFLKNRFCFHNVGQGLFYSGSLNYGEYNFIYNCGSKNLRYINSAVKNYCSYINKKQIDFIVISHFHFDHISGIEELRKNIHINKVFMPYLFDDKDLTYLAIWGAVNLNEEGDITDKNELVDYLYALHYNSDRAVVIKDGFSFESHGWVFKFYNNSIDESKVTDLEIRIKKELILRGYSNIQDIISDGCIKYLKDIYFNVFGSGNILNDTSLVLLHYPIDNNPEYLAYHDRGICDPFSLLTGDIQFDSALAAKVISGYPDRPCGIGLVPHHGSKNNWMHFYSSFSTIDYYVVSSGLKSLPRFPDPIIAKTLPSHNYIEVNEIEDFSYYVI